MVPLLSNVREGMTSSLLPFSAINKMINVTPKQGVTRNTHRTGCVRVLLISVFVDGPSSSSGFSSSCLSSEGVLMLMVLFSFVVFSASNHICCNCPEK